jgi:hypothetical protein
MMPRKKRGGKVRARLPTTASRTPRHEKPEAAKTILAGFLMGLLVTVVLICANRVFEQSLWGSQILAMSYNLLQRQLSSGGPTADLPVVIVDINDLKTDNSTQATPRKALEALVDQIAAQSPKSIGIDLDFSPDVNDYITQDDPEFFDYCLDLRRQVPTYLGIWRSQANSPDQWLGAQDYEGLAASIMIPKEDTREMVERIVSEDGRQKGWTMAGALAKSIQEVGHNVPSWIDWAVESTSETKLSSGLGLERFLVDYSPLKALEKERLRTKNPDVIADQGRLLRDKIVIVGDGTVGAQGDNFVVPGHGGTTPGIYFHACAAYTLAKAPLYRLTLRGRITIDMLLSVVVLGSVTLIRLQYRNATWTVVTHRIHRLFTVIVALSAFVVGYLFVSRTRIFWDDFILVIAALLLHPYLEHAAIKMSGRCRVLVPAAWRRLVFDEQEEKR